MIHVNQAINNAVDHLRSLPNASSSDFYDVRLEEFELLKSKSESNDFNSDLWLITLGYTIKIEVPLDESYLSVPGLTQLNKSHERIYKIFYIDAENGDVKAMKIRTL